MLLSAFHKKINAAQVFATKFKVPLRCPCYGFHQKFLCENISNVPRAPRNRSHLREISYENDNIVMRSRRIQQTSSTNAIFFPASSTSNDFFSCPISNFLSLQASQAAGRSLFATCNLFEQLQFSEFKFSALIYRNTKIKRLQTNVYAICSFLHPEMSHMVGYGSFRYHQEHE